MSEEFCAVKYWAPFVLIGDDIHLNLDVKKESTEMMRENSEFLPIVVVVFL